MDRQEINESDGRKMRRLSEIDNYTFGGLPPPALHHPYEPTIRDRMCFHSITVMKVRFYCLTDKNSNKTM